MEVTISQQPPADVAADVLVIPIFEGEDFSQGALAALDGRLGGILARMAGWKDISGKAYQSSMVPAEGRIAAARVATIGCGKRDAFDATIVRQVAAAAARRLAGHSASSAAFLLSGGLPDAAEVRGVAEGFVRGQYQYDKYKTGDEKTPEAESLTILTPAGPAAGPLEDAARIGRMVGEAANYARRLIDEPPSRMTPSNLADEAKALGAEFGLEMEVFGPEELQKLGAEALLGVSRGSAEPPRLIVLRHRGALGDSRTLAMVGKGITFDSGGLDLKPSNAMEGMKSDMSGAAAVLGAMRVIGALKPAVNVLGVIPATENMPGSRAIKPGDVLRAIGGKTLEVDNTDAEGRVILADALGYAQNLGATHIVDLATLTGACIVALGNDISGLMGAPQAWVDRVWDMAKVAGERLWQLPLPEDYKDLIKSEVADIKNVGGRAGGTITGALFLQAFIKEGVAWAHLDIAGPAFIDKARPYLPVGATGVGVGTLVDLTLGFAETPR
ncbi:MAG: leucyl aminopeptidase [Chloroflexi bacterium]|nr:leucyl aminopeptidase [Chloroflexota bacterium]